MQFGRVIYLKTLDQKKAVCCCGVVEDLEDGSIAKFNKFHPT